MRLSIVKRYSFWHNAHWSKLSSAIFAALTEEAQDKIANKNQFGAKEVTRYGNYTYIEYARFADDTQGTIRIITFNAALSLRMTVSLPTTIIGCHFATKCYIERPFLEEGR